MVKSLDKGKRGEREVCTLLNNAYLKLLPEKKRSLISPEDYPFQRNTLQNAVGGSDINNNFCLDIEVKFQEKLEVNRWWNQCLASAYRNEGSVPILFQRQTNKPWNIYMRLCDIAPQCPEKLKGMRVSINFDYFEGWFESYMEIFIK